MTVRRAAAVTGAVAILLTLAAGAAAVAAPLPTDGSGSCTKDFCVVVAEDPAPLAQPVRAPAPSGGGGGRSAGWTPMTQDQLITATTWDAHVNTLCANARATGIAMPTECLPTPAAPAGAPAPPAAQPADATKKAMQQLRPAPAKIGSAPCATTEPGCVGGAVGVPVWLWTQPWTAQTATATAGPYTVTAVARPTSVTWDLGDGQRITCATRGTPYELSWGFRDSPDCGTRYERVGKYSISAVMTYAVTWSGADSGSATIQSAPTTVPVDIGEYQVVIHNSTG